MQQITRKLMMTLVLLLTAVGGAWAESKPIGLNVEYAVGDVITTNSTGDVYVWWGIYSKGGENYEWVIKITSSVTPTISKLGIVESSGSITFVNDYAVYDMNGNIAANSYSIQCQGEVTGTTLEKVHVASGSGTLTDPYVFAPGSAPAATVVTPTGNANEWSMAMPAGNVLLTVAYKDRATMALTYGGTPITTEANAVTAFKGCEQEFAEALTPAVQNIEPTFNSGTAQNVTTTLAADFTFKSSNANIIGFKSGQTYADEGTLDQMEFRALTTSPVTLTVTYKGTDDLESKSQTLLVTIEKKTYTVSLADNTKDADSWKGNVNDAETDVNLPITNLEGGETITLQYNGRLKVKGVKAVVEAPAPSVTEVTTFSELQTALSAGKNVKLKNDIVCTAEIEITSNGALTIDGNGKKLSTTSEIRAFKVWSSATVAFKDLTLTGFVNGGGPAINNSGTIVLDGCTISNCHVNNSNGGGAIENKSNGKLYAINTTFSGNYSGEIGGAINNYNSSLYMSGCTFTNNYTTKNNAYWGGAIGINKGSEVRLINCSFSGNQYGTNAGPSDIGVYSNPTNYTIAGCTGATIASRVAGDITTNTTGTATLDYSDLSNISFTYNAE